MRAVNLSLAALLASATATLAAPSGEKPITIDIPSDSALVKRLLEKRYDRTRPDDAQPSRPEGSSGSNCVRLTDADLGNLPPTTWKNMFYWLSTQRGADDIRFPGFGVNDCPNGYHTYTDFPFPKSCERNGATFNRLGQPTVQISGQQDNSYSSAATYKCMGYGRDGSGDECFNTFYVPTITEINRVSDRTRWAYACLGDAQIGQFQGAGGGAATCSAQSQYIQGDIKGTPDNVEVKVTIDRSASFDYSVDVSESQSFTAGAEVTVSGGVSGIAEASATVSFSYTYSSDKTVSEGKSTTSQNSVEVTFNPTAGESRVVLARMGLVTDCFTIAFQVKRAT